MSPLLSELRRLGKRRITLPDLRAAFLRAHPEAAGAPDLRQLLLSALEDLSSAGALVLPRRGWDKSGSPALPGSASLPASDDSRPRREPHAWLPLLAFAASERHPARRAALQAINAFLLSRRGASLLPVPTNERSLQIFGDEKKLDALRKGKATLYEGRLSLDDLGCYPVTPPLPYETADTGEAGRLVLVVENHHSFESFRRWNAAAGGYAAIAYGGGNAFRQGIGHLEALVERTAARGAVYLGDLDPAGIDILLAVSGRRGPGARRPLAPHCGLYRWLLANGRRRPLDIAPRPVMRDRLKQVFPPDLAAAVAGLWAGGERIPQESFGREELAGPAASIAGPAAAAP